MATQLRQRKAYVAGDIVLVYIFTRPDGSQIAAHVYSRATWDVAWKDGLGWKASARCAAPEALYQLPEAPLRQGC